MLAQGGNIRQAILSTVSHMQFMLRAGFPPTDKDVRHWLLRPATEEQAKKRANALVYALLAVTLERLKTIDGESGRGSLAHTKKRYEDLASNFHRLMVKGQTFSDPNPYRQEFYREVIVEAEKVRPILIYALVLTGFSSQMTPLLSKQRECLLKWSQKMVCN